ncbi:MAG: hypothetical protein Q9159_007508 [Coniocarpon cinnabarinum]
MDYDVSHLPDHDNDFVDEADIAAFVKALQAPDDLLKSPELASSVQDHHSTRFITALNDWRPVRQRVRKEQQRTKRKRRKKPVRGVDETREGFGYALLKWPLLAFVLTWIVCLAAAYAATRLYIWAYEALITTGGKREALRKRLHSAENYEQWVAAAKNMDRYLGNDEWKRTDDYAYYNCDTINAVKNHLHRLRTRLTELQEQSSSDSNQLRLLADELRGLLESSVKDNFVGVENARLYSETYYGTKELVESFLHEVSSSLKLLSETPHLSRQSKSTMFSHLSANYGRTALCLSGGATFAYYHFGIARALIDAGSLPNIITGTSGGALVAALLCTRTHEELKHLLVPSLAHRITACGEPFSTTARRWWHTGAQFDSVDWARRCSWFCRGSLTFREAYERTGRILNITAIPSNPHSPTVLANYLTSPDCVIWSACLASAAVPGILNPVVLMRKNTRTGALEPYSFGHKWKDGSLRTDIPLNALNTHFNVTYSIVSQVNPHINLFFFSSRGTVGRPVTHRRGRGWRGGFVGSATEQYLKLDLTKWLKVLRHLELLPRYAEQDWSNIWLQRFDGTITIWPKSHLSDFRYILSDPTPERLARMLWTGMLSCWPKLKFVRNRMMIEEAINEGVRTNGTSDNAHARGPIDGTLDVPSSSEDDELPEWLSRVKRVDEAANSQGNSNDRNQTASGQRSSATHASNRQSSTFFPKFSTWLSLPRSNSDPPIQRKRHSWAYAATPVDQPNYDTNSTAIDRAPKLDHDPSFPAAVSFRSPRRGSMLLQELSRQAGVFRDDALGTTSASESEVEGDDSDVAPLESESAPMSSLLHGDEDGEGVGDVMGK